MNIAVPNVIIKGPYPARIWLALVLPNTVKGVLFGLPLSITEDENNDYDNVVVFHDIS